MAYPEGRPASELEDVIAARRRAEHIESLALQAFSAEELAALPADLHKVLDMLFRRRIAEAGADLGLADCLRIRQQFEQYCDNRVGNPLVLRLATQLR